MIKKRDKRGSEGILESPTVFIILNILFIALMFSFASNAAAGTGLYEKKYAKEIALTLDVARPGMEISFDMGKGLELAEESENARENIVKIDNVNNVVTVSLSSKGSYSYQYFSNLNVVVGGFDEDGRIKLITESKLEESVDVN